MTVQCILLWHTPLVCEMVRLCSCVCATVICDSGIIIDLAGRRRTF